MCIQNLLTITELIYHVVTLSVLDIKERTPLVPCSEDGPSKDTGRTQCNAYMIVVKIN